MEVPLGLLCFLCIWILKIITFVEGRHSEDLGRSYQLSIRKSHIGPVPFVNEVMTEWADWGSWEKCSRSCGGGVRSRTRTCITRFPRIMPGSGIRTSHDRCSGDSVQYELCGPNPCPAGQISGVSFRAAQCRYHNNRKVLGRVVNSWVPYTQGGINPCALVCEGEGEGIVYTFGKVTDGTYCKTDEGQRGLCVNGRCMRLSCDGRLGGIAQEDMCRVCGGHNETCTRHRGVFHSERPSADQPFPGLSPGPAAQAPQSHTKSKSFGYHEVTKIPRGSTYVKVFENSSNFLALKSGDKYLLNGDWLIDWPGEIDAAGSSFSYVRKEDQSEALTTLGPTNSDLVVMVLLREHNPGIFYEYWIPNKDMSVFSSSSVTLQTDQPIKDTATGVSSAAILATTAKPDNSEPVTSSVVKSNLLRPAVLTALTLNKSLLQQQTSDHGGSGGDRKSEDGSREGKQSSETGFKEADSLTLPYVSKLYKKSKLAHPPWRSNLVYDYHFKSKKLKKPDSQTDAAAKKPAHYKYSNTDEANTKKKQKSNRKNKKKKRKKKKKKKRPENCEECSRRQRAKQNFCTSDFVSRIEVLSEEEVGEYTRYEVLVMQSYKNKVPLLHKEFLWTHQCACRRLRPGKSYIVMGMTQKGQRNEVQLVLRSDSYVRKFSDKVLKRIMKFRGNEMKHCRRWRSNTALNQFGFQNNLFQDLRNY